MNSTSPAQSNLPFLPGYNIDTTAHSAKNFKKAHLFDQHQGTRLEPGNRVAKMSEEKNFYISTNPLQVPTMTQEFKSKQQVRASPETTMSLLPSWVAYDRKVLRFYGYFEESIVASAAETWRIRKFVLTFHLEDDSIAVNEPKINNSGIPQGSLVKRHRIPKLNNQYYTVEDFFIGAEIAIYGRVFKLVACDDFTRAFYGSRGKELGPDQEYPLDRFTERSAVKATTFKKLMNPLKQFMEADLGKPANQGVEHTQQFLRNDGKVLRFFGSWDDKSMYGEKKPYIIHYFLADDTIEVLEVMAPNSGRDAFPNLLKRGRLPRNFKDNSPCVPRIGVQTDTKTVEFYSEADLKVGVTLNIYGREVQLLGCDAFTKSFYMQNYGMTESDFPDMQMQAPPRAAPIMLPPPPTGYGTEEDSLGSFLYLMPKVPKRDLKKLMENDGVILRFATKFVNPTPEDANRIFIISYYMADDTVGIYEKFQRNSGFIGGKFLERSKMVNPTTQEYYKLADFQIGQRVRVNTYDFIVEGTDEYTNKYLANMGC